MVYLMIFLPIYMLLLISKSIIILLFSSGNAYLLTYCLLLFCVSPDSSVYQAVSTDFCAAVVLLQLSALQGSLELVSSI